MQRAFAVAEEPWLSEFMIFTETLFLQWHLQQQMHLRLYLHSQQLQSGRDVMH
ncbi:hypothetical protein [Anaerobiospirillum sp. NML120449]|uniref:hypothetical protein n=1 Tax=Anaerobiospirillum sp. NML120449 TaxID=2932817 RepID=UPI001FF5438F|nr:hypothetical protein [Anaerobiospirillum sp. NML120449]MCK0525365.1 hypothetical protein [Anaerobiospirillum sp. NML120449]